MSTLNGITFGGLLFVIASGFTLIFGLMRVVNMAHGMFYLLGAFVGWSVQQATGNWFLALGAGTCAVAATAFLVQTLVLRVKGDLPRTLLTLGIGTLIGDICLWIWGGLPRTFDAPKFLRFPIQIGPITYPSFRLFVLGLAVVLGVGLWLLLYRTRLGRLIRAGVDNRAMVSALGINIDQLFIIVFVLGGLISGLGGTIGGSYLAFGPGTDFEILTFALVVVIIGGMGSLQGSIIGALLVGLIDNFGRTYFAGVSIFLLSGTLLLVLLLRPQGLFGRPD